MKAGLNQEPIEIGVGRACWIIEPTETLEIIEIPKILADDH